jgi:PAS domain S-box-containing protein
LNRQKTNQENRDREILLSEMTNMIPGVVYQFFARKNGDMGFNYVSPKSEQIIGLNPDLEGYLKRFVQLIIPEQRDDFIKSIERSVRELSEWAYEGILQKPSGEKIWFLCNSIPSPQENGIIYNGIVQDITERKKAESALRNSEEKYRQLVESVQEGIWVIDDNSFTTFVNPHMAEMLGYSVDEMTGKDFCLFIDKSGKETAARLLERRAKGIREERDFEFLKKDGSRIYANLKTTPQTDESGGYIGAIAAVMDVTARKRMEDALKKSEAHYKQLFEAIPESVLLIGPDRRVVAANQASAHLYGYESPGQIVGFDTRSMIADKDRERVAGIQTSILQGEERPARQYKQVRHDGSEFVAEVISTTLYGPQQEVTGYIGISRDITAVVRAEELLKESRDRLELALTSAQLGIWDWDIVNDRMVWDKQMFLLYGVADKNTVSGIELWRNSLHPEDAARAWDECQAAMHGEKKFDIEFRILHPDGAIRIVKADGIVLRDQNGKAIRMLGVSRDITEPKRAEEDLAKTKLLLEETFEQSPLPMVLVSMPDAHFSIINSAAKEFLGIADEPSLIGTSLMDYKPSFVDCDIQGNPGMVHSLPLARALSGQKTSNEERLIIRKDGTSRWEMVSAAPIFNKIGEVIAGYLAMNNITEWKQAEEELRKAQKLESLGILAGGIAHDFNNLLGGIYGYIDMAGEGAKDEKLSRYLSKAMNTIERAKGLTLQLLTFAKGGAPIKKVGNLFPFVQEAAKFALSGSSVSCGFEVPKDISLCDFDKNQIGQVIDNIVINAKQAMPDGGAITLTASNVRIAKNDHPPLDSGDYIRISIKDSGIGMPKEILPRIFDPFYTTKATGHGLGLASCYSIIKRHGGSIDVESEPGKGSTFHIYLPASKDSAPYSSEASKSDHKGNGIFLVVDDEEVMQEAFRDMLEMLGYAVVCRKDGREAIQFVSSEIKAGKEMAGMIFDLTIPGGMGGKDAIGEIREMSLKNPIFVTSGYAEDPIMANPREYGFTASICKPFTKSELSDMLSKFMNPKD